MKYKYNEYKGIEDIINRFRQGCLSSYDLTHLYTKIRLDRNTKRNKT